MDHDCHGAVVERTDALGLAHADDGIGCSGVGGDEHQVHPVAEDQLLRDVGSMCRVGLAVLDHDLELLPRRRGEKGGDVVGIAFDKGRQRPRLRRNIAEPDLRPLRRAGAARPGSASVSPVAVDVCRNVRLVTSVAPRL